jgi:hypothetical protein
MKDVRLSEFHLAGGTSLAIYLGHRISIDLDLFTVHYFEASSLEKYLVDRFDYRGDYLEKNTLKGTINGIKVDLITHNYPAVEEPLITKDGLRLYGMKDIAAMKLSAIADDGSRLKDFVDIACLSAKISLSDMLQAYRLKYRNSNPVRPLKGLTYYEDINFNEPILLTEGSFSWDIVRQRLHQMINREHDLFGPLVFS